MLDKKKILIVEDEIGISRFLGLELEYEGYEVETAEDGRTGLEKGLKRDIDLIILDIMLPELNGMEVCRRIRLSSDVPIIMLTAKDETLDKVMGLDLGADDYVTKPFAIEELLARIRATFRKKSMNSSNSHTNCLTIGSLKLNVEKHVVAFDNHHIDLTKKEFDLLKYLMENKNIVLSREKILDHVWSYDYLGDTNVVDVYIRYLRSKIDNKYNKKLIHTIRGVGYTVKDE